MGKITRRRTLRAGLSVGLTAPLAGCSSLRSARTETEELVAAVESVPGVEDGRVVSASTLADAHHDAVAGFKRSATRRGTITNSPVGPDESHGTVHTEIRIDDGTFFHRITREGEPEWAREEYIDGGDRYLAFKQGSEWTVERIGNRAGTSRTWLSGTLLLMRLSDAVRVVGTESQYGEQHYLFSRQSDGSESADESAESYLRGRYLFRDDGLCREFMRVERIDDTPDRTQVIEWSLSDIGDTAVGEPEWLEQVE